jgi:hypothetical protein
MTWRQLSDDVAMMSFPWRTLGIDFRRNVTILRLSDGRVMIHSTAPSTAEDVAAILNEQLTEIIMPMRFSLHSQATQEKIGGSKRGQTRDVTLAKFRH